MVIPNSPQLETKLVYALQRSPEIQKLVRRFDYRSAATGVEFHHQLFDVI